MNCIYLIQGRSYVLENSVLSYYSDIGACGVTLTPPANKKVLLETMKVPRTKGELTLDQLPPIEELKISVPEEQCIEIGVVTSIIDQLGIVFLLKTQKMNIRLQ